MQEPDLDRDVSTSGSRSPFVPEMVWRCCALAKSAFTRFAGICSCTLRNRSQGARGPLLGVRAVEKKAIGGGTVAEERKKALPFLPASIGIVTSEKGAALWDMLRIIGDRYPDRRIIVWPVKVQGEGAAEEIAAGITNSVNRAKWMSDCWAWRRVLGGPFGLQRGDCGTQHLCVAGSGNLRSRSRIDFTIADFVAIFARPRTAAAEIVVPQKSELADQVMVLQEQLLRCMRRELEMAKENWRGFVKRLADPQRKMPRSSSVWMSCPLILCEDFKIACIG